MPFPQPYVPVASFRRDQRGTTVLTCEKPKAANTIVRVWINTGWCEAGEGQPPFEHEGGKPHALSKPDHRDRLRHRLKVDVPESTISDGLYIETMNHTDSSPKCESTLSLSEAERRLAQMQTRFPDLVLRAVLLDTKEAIRQVPERLAAQLTPLYRGNIHDAVWFPELPANAREVVLSEGSEIRQPEDMDGIVSAYFPPMCLQSGYGTQGSRRLAISVEGRQSGR